MNNILLTGVSGLVGRHVLYELLRESLETQTPRKIIVTFRSGELPAAERLARLFEPGACPKYLADYPLQTLLRDVQVLETDLLDPALAAHLHRLDMRDLCVIHSAASTNLAPSEAAQQDVSANVSDATDNLLQAVTGIAAKFVYIGTAFATGAVSGTLDDDFSRFACDRSRNHYERAKLQAERAIIAHCERNAMAWQILRPSVVCGRLLDAPLHYTSKFDVFYGYARFFSRLAAAGSPERVRILCGTQSSVNVVPVDYVARAIVRSLPTRIAQLNIVHPQNVSGRDLVAGVVRAVGFERFEFVEAMPDDLNETEKLYYATAGAIFSSYLTSPEQRYDARRLGLLLDGLPPPDVAGALPDLMGYAIDCEFSSARCAQQAFTRARREPPRRVVFVGSGYVACYAYQKLRRRLRAQMANGQVEVVVVSTSNYHVFHGFVGEVVAGTLPLDTAFSPSRQLFQGARFVQGAVTGVDLDQQRLQYAGSGGERGTLRYDELILATGSENDSAEVPGLDRYGLSVRSFATLHHLQQHVVQMLESAEGASDPEDARRSLTFCIAGAGFTGVEMCTALAQLLDNCRPHYSILKRVPARLVLVHAGEEILPEMQAGFGRLVRYARQKIEAYGIDLRLNTRLKKVEPLRVLLDDGSWIDSRSVISTVGHRPTVLPGTERCLFDTQRRLVGDRNLNLRGYDNVWVGGDCASIRQPLRKTACPTNALWAIKHGQHIGRNVARRLRGRPLRPFRFLGLGQAANLGDYKGIAELYGLQITGFPAKVIRLWFFLYYMPNKRNAVQVLFELVLRGVFGARLLVAREVDGSEAADGAGLAAGSPLAAEDPRQAVGG